MAWTKHSAAIVAALNDRAGRPSVIFRYAKKVIENELWDILPLLGILPTARYPKGVHYYGEPLGEIGNAELWPQILIGGMLTEEPYSLGGIIQHNANLSISAMFPAKVFDHRQFLESIDLAMICMAIMFSPPYNGAFGDPDDPTKIIWNMTPPSGLNFVFPSEASPLAGWAAHIDVTQAAGKNLWPLAS